MYYKCEKEQRTAIQEKKKLHANKGSTLSRENLGDAIHSIMPIQIESN